MAAPSPCQFGFWHSNQQMCPGCDQKKVSVHPQGAVLGPIPEPSPQWPTRGRDCQAIPQQGTSQSLPPPPKSKASPEGLHPFVVTTRMRAPRVPRGRAHRPRPLNPTASTVRTKAAWPVPCSVAGRDHPRAHTHARTVRP